MKSHEIRILQNTEEHDENSLERDCRTKVGCDEIAEVQESDVREILVAKRVCRDHRDKPEDTERQACPAQAQPSPKPVDNRVQTTSTQKVRKKSENCSYPINYISNLHLPLFTFILLRPLLLVSLPLSP